RGAATEFSAATPRLTVVGHELNRLGNMAAFNPGGANPPGTPGRDEGYLYWAAWLGHNGSLTFDSQDANGPYRRLYLTANCANLESTVSVNPLAPLITNFGPVISAVCP